MALPRLSVKLWFQFSVPEAGIQNRAMFKYPTSGNTEMNHNLTDNRGRAVESYFEYAMTI